MDGDSLWLCYPVKMQRRIKMSEFKDVVPREEENTAYSKYFVGQSYLNMLSVEQVVIGNVTFEPGCRKLDYVA